MFHHFCRARFAAAMAVGRDEGERSFGRQGARGRGGPFGRHHGGPFGGRGRRMFDAGALRLVVLGLIADPARARRLGAVALGHALAVALGGGAARIALVQIEEDG